MKCAKFVLLLGAIVLIGCGPPAMTSDTGGTDATSDVSGDRATDALVDSSTDGPRPDVAVDSRSDVIVDTSNPPLDANADTMMPSDANTDTIVPSDANADTIIETDANADAIVPTDANADTIIETDANADTTVPADVNPCPNVGMPCGGADVDGCTSRYICEGGQEVCIGTFVSPAGDDTNPGTQTSPRRSIESAIWQAETLRTMLGGPQTVCACTGMYTGRVTLTEGISLYGGYECGTWARDATAFPTTIESTLGFSFASGVTEATEVNRVRVLGRSSPGGESVAISIVDASPTLTEVEGRGGLAPTSTGLLVRGVSMTSLARPRIVGGVFTAEAEFQGRQFGAAMQNAAPNVTGTSFGDTTNTRQPDATTGLECVQCPGATFTNVTALGGTARTTSFGAHMSGDFTGLTFSGSASGGTGIAGSPGTEGQTFGLHITGVGAPTFTGTFTGGTGPASSSVAVLVGSDMFSPRIYGSTIVGCAGSSANVDDCYGVKTDSSPLILETSYINQNPSGGPLSAPSRVRSVGVRIVGGSSTTIVRDNQIQAGAMSASATEGFGVELIRSGAKVERNRIRGADCTISTSATAKVHAVRINGGTATLQNSFVTNGGCPGVDSFSLVRIEHSDGNTGSMNVLHNTLRYASLFGQIAHGLEVQFTSASNNAGIVANNLFVRVSVSFTGYAVWEVDANSDPGIMMGNDFFNTEPVYINEGNTTGINTSDVNTGGLYSSNVNLDPRLTADGHLGVGSGCIDIAAIGFSPLDDIDMQPRAMRGTGPDIGADEF